MNKTISLFVMCLLGINFASIAQPKTLASHPRLEVKNCQKENEDDAFLFAEEFKWGYSLEELIGKFYEIYGSSKRLRTRAFLDEKANRLILPNEKFRGGDILLPISFVDNVATHIEQGLNQGVVDGVFFPDMGHSHVFIPEQRYNSHYEQIPISEYNRFYEDLFLDADIKILYHTAEQLQLLDQDNRVIQDPRVQFRYRTRNLVGSNNGSSELLFIHNPQSKQNTAHELPGYRYWGAGFNLSASKEGCFKYYHNGQVFHFDLSLYDLAPQVPTSMSETY